VIERLGLTDPVTVNWNNGLGTVYSEADADSTVFVTPPVNGWTFVVGLAIPQPLGKAFVDKATALILDLGVHFIEVQYYLAYPAFDCFAWARVVNGKLLRAYAVNDEGVVWNKGRTSKEERTLGVKLYEVRGVKTRQGDAGGELVMYPTEQHVLQVAGKWGLDPSKLDTTTATGPAQGLIARTPNSWLPQTIRRAG
jgi:hypothetical protein